MNYRSSIAGPTTINYDRVKRSAFHDNNMLIVDLRDPNLSWVEVEQLKQIGHKLFGKPRNSSALAELAARHPTRLFAKAR